MAIPTVYRPRRPLASHGRPGDATNKALRAHALAGTTIYVTEAQAARLEGASLTYVSALRCMSAAERDAVRAGTLKLVDYVAKRWRRPDVDALVAEQPERALAALERLTAPSAEDSAAA